MLELTTEEENLLTYVGANYKNVVVLVNSTNVMELGQLETIPGVDACLIAGLMRGEQERTELAFRFKEVCQEQIVCPGIVDLFTMDDFDGSTAAAMREAMEQNVAADSDFTLEYYISHVLYLSRRA